MEDVLDYIMDWAWYLVEEAGIWIGGNPVPAAVLGLVLMISLLTVLRSPRPHRRHRLPAEFIDDLQKRQAIEQAFERAKQTLTLQQRLSPDAARILRDLKGGRTTSAVTYFRQIAEEHEQSAAEAWRHHGAMCAYEQDAFRAMEAFERAERLRPAHDNAWRVVVEKLRP